MDAIYKTCKYNFPCFFLTVKTSVGIGQVVATIIPEFETEEMLSQGLQILKSWTLTWNPSFFVTDKSSVELNAVAQVHPKAVRLFVTSIEHRHEITGSTRTVMELRLNSRQLFQLNSRHWHMHQQVYAYLQVAYMM